MYILNTKEGHDDACHVWRAMTLLSSPTQNRIGCVAVGGSSSSYHFGQLAHTALQLEHKKNNDLVCLA